MNEQRDPLAGRLAELDELTVDPQHVERSIAAISQAGVERVSLPKIIESLVNQIADLRAQLTDADAQEREERIAAAKAAMAEPLAAVVKSVQQLDRVLSEYDAALQAVGRAGAMPIGDVPAGLRQGIGATMQYWRFARPELLGLPARPTPAEDAVINAKADLEHLESLERRIRQYRDAAYANRGTIWDERPFGERSKDTRRLIERARERLAELEGKGPVRELLGV